MKHTGIVSKVEIKTVEHSRQEYAVVHCDGRRFSSYDPRLIAVVETFDGCHVSIQYENWAMGGGLNSYQLVKIGFSQ